MVPFTETKGEHNMKFLACGLLFCVAAFSVYGASIQRDAWGAAAVQRSQSEYINRVEDQAREEKEAFEKRTKEIIEVYNTKMKSILETKELDSSLSLQQNADKLQLKVVQVKNLNEAKPLAKKLAANDKDFVEKQIDNSNRLSLYEINEAAPFYIKDETIEMTNIIHVDANLNYTTEKIVKKCFIRNKLSSVKSNLY